MITGSADYSITFQRSTTISGTYSNFGQYVDIGFPELSMDEVNATNHLSAGVEQFLMSGLLKSSDFDVTFVMDSSMLTTAYGDLSGATSNWYKISFPSNMSKAAWNFEAFTKGVKIDKSADATKPELLKVKVTFRPTGAFTGLS